MEKYSLKVTLPNKIGEIKLIHNGKLISILESNEGEFIVDKNGVLSSGNLSRWESLDIFQSH